MKLDGLMFLLGVGSGVVAFAETEPLFTGFWHTAGFLGRVTIPGWLGIAAGVVVLAVVLMALGAFRAAEWSEKSFAKKFAKEEA